MLRLAGAARFLGPGGALGLLAVLERILRSAVRPSCCFMSPNLHIPTEGSGPASCTCWGMLKMYQQTQLLMHLCGRDTSIQSESGHC